MEKIQQAIERAKGRHAVDLDRGFQTTGVQRKLAFGVGANLEVDSPLPEVTLDDARLVANRLIAHNAANPLAKAFDMLRTQVLQSMDARGWKILAVTSPTAGCGKTVTALNLALSMARQPERSVVLADLDFQKPKVATNLGLYVRGGASDVLKGQSRLSSVMVRARIGSAQFRILPTDAAPGSSELIASRAMVHMLQELKNDFQSQTVILDLPPVLSSDDVIAILPHVDCVLLVVAMGTSTIAEIEASKQHLNATEVVRVVVNKVPDMTANYYGYS